jgi:hypothetical protein
MVKHAYAKNSVAIHAVLQQIGLETKRENII